MTTPLVTCATCGRELTEFNGGHPIAGPDGKLHAATCPSVTEAPPSAPAASPEAVPERLLDVACDVWVQATGHSGPLNPSGRKAMRAVLEAVPLRVPAASPEVMEGVIADLRTITLITPDFDGEDEDGERHELHQCLETAKRIANRAITAALKGKK